MEFLTDSLKEVVASKLSEDQKEEIDIIETIVNTKETSKESIKENLFHFLEKRGPENRIRFVIMTLGYTTKIRPK